MNKPNVRVTAIAVVADLRSGDLFSFDFGDTWHVFDRWADGRVEVCGEASDDDNASLEAALDRPCVVRLH